MSLRRLQADPGLWSQVASSAPDLPPPPLLTSPGHCLSLSGKQGGAQGRHRPEHTKVGENFLKDKNKSFDRQNLNEQNKLFMILDKQTK